VDADTLLILSAMAVFVLLSILNQAVLVFGDVIQKRWGGLALKTALAARELSYRLYVPSWTFFSWIPTFDIHVLIRDQLIGGEFTPWRRVTYARRAPLRWIWNPDRRRASALSTLAYQVVRHLLTTQSEPPSESLLRRSLEYQALISSARAICASPFTITRQFMILRTAIPAGSKTHEISLISPWFSISSGLLSEEPRP
jgi:hypothetical protein